MNTASMIAIQADKSHKKHKQKLKLNKVQCIQIT